MVNEVVVTDFRQHYRPKQINKKSITTRIIHQVLINDLSSNGLAKILIDKDMIEQVKGFSVFQLIELAGILNANRAVMINFDFAIFDEKITIPENVVLPTSAKPSEYELTKLLMNELSVQYANNFRSIYESSISGTSLPFLNFLVSATPVEIETLTVTLSQREFIKYQCFPKLINSAICESKGIFSQDATCMKALRFGATKQLVDYFFPQHSYSDQRSISMIRRLTGEKFELEDFSVEKKQTVINELREQHSLIKSEYNNHNISIEEFKMKVFTLLLKTSEVENISLKKLAKASKFFDHL